MAIICEVVDDNNGFKFRLVEGSEKTDWASYTQVAYLNGMCCATDYYLGDGSQMKVISCQEFVKAIAVGISKP